MCVGNVLLVLFSGRCPFALRVRRDIVQNTSVNMGENGKMLKMLKKLIFLCKNCFLLGKCVFCFSLFFPEFAKFYVYSMENLRCRVWGVYRFM